MNKDIYLLTIAYLGGVIVFPIAHYISLYVDIDSYFYLAVFGFSLWVMGVLLWQKRMAIKRLTIENERYIKEHRLG